MPNELYGAAGVASRLPLGFRGVWRRERSKELSVTINGRALSRLSPCIRRTCRDDRFYALLAPWSCGAFDGGCLIVAEALRQALGTGTLYGLWGTRITGSTGQPSWMHAVLCIGHRYVDGDGVAHKALLIDRWRKQELVIVTSFQPMPVIEQQGVPFATPYNPRVIDHMAAFFCQQFGTTSYSALHK